MKKINETNKNTGGYWDKVYRIPKDLTQKPIDAFRNLVITSHIEDGPKKVLDIGCGNGELLLVIQSQKPDAELFGVDISKFGIEVARKAIPSGYFRVSEAIKTGFPDASFDYIVCSETLEHLDNPEELFNEVKRLLMSGGKLILTTPYSDHVPSEEHVWQFDYGDIGDMLDDSGFDNFWVFPWASGRGRIDGGKMTYERGNWDTIFCLAIK